MIGDITKGIDFELLEVLKGHFVQEPVNDHSSLDSSLRVENKDNLLLAVVEKSVLDKDVAVSDVLRGVEQSTLNQALDEIEYNSSTRDVSVSYLGLVGLRDLRSVVNTNNWSMECS